MKSTFDNKISGEPLDNFNKEKTFEFAKVIDMGIDVKPLNTLNYDWLRY